MILEFDEDEDILNYLISNNFMKEDTHISFPNLRNSTRKCGPFMYWKTNHPSIYKFNFGIMKRISRKR